MSEKQKLKDLLVGSGGGIPGITRPVDSQPSERGMTVYKEKQPKGPGLGSKIGDVLLAPVDVAVVVVQAGVGATILGLAKKVSVVNPDVSSTKKLSPKKTQQRLERKAREEQLESWTGQIDQVVTKSACRRRDDNETIALATQTIGPEAMQQIDRVRQIRNAVPVNIEPAQQNERNFAQKVLATLTDQIGIESAVDSELNGMTLSHIRKIGVEAIDVQEAAELRKLEREMEVPVTRVSFGEGLLAAILGAAGRQKKMAKGGFEVGVKGGMVTSTLGGDDNQLALPHQITVDTDIPGLYESAIVAAKGKLPGLDGGRFSNWVARTIGYDPVTGKVPVLPGMVTIGNTGNSETVVFPALNAPEQSRRITRLKKAGELLSTRLQVLENVREEDHAQMVRRLQDEAVEGMLDIPRRPVVLDLIKQIVDAGGMPIEQAIIEAAVIEAVHQETVVEGTALEMATASQVVNKPKTEEVMPIPVAKVKRKLSSKKLQLQMEKDLKSIGGFDRLSLDRAKMYENNLEERKVEWVIKYGERRALQIAESVTMKLNMVFYQYNDDLRTLKLTEMSRGRAEALIAHIDDFEKQLQVKYGAENAKRMKQSVLYKGKQVLKQKKK